MRIPLLAMLLCCAMPVAAQQLKPWSGGTTPALELRDVEGRLHRLADYRGKVVLVNFWATYCGACLKEMPKLVDTHRKFAARGYDTIAIAVRHDNAERVAGFAASRALPFQVAFDGSGELAKDFGNVRLTPTSFLIDKRGRVIWRAVGEPNWSELHERVERALGDSGS